MAVSTLKVVGIDIGEDTEDIIDVISSTLERDVCEIFIQTLYGKNNIFDYIIQNENISKDVTLTLFTNDNSSISVHVCQPKRGNNSLTYLSFAIFNATYRTCILPYLSKEMEPVTSFPNVDISSLEGVFDCKDRKRVSANRCDYNLIWFLTEALKNDIMDGHMNMVDANSDEEIYSKCTIGEERREAIKDLILNQTDARMMEKLFKHRLRSGKIEKEMMRCSNPNHNDNKPSMKVTVLPFSWQKSKRIVVNEETNKELIDLYFNDKGRDTKFTYVSDNAVKDTRTNKIYVLYTVKRSCYSCYFSC